MDNSLAHQMPVVYIPHGGGPMPLLGDPGHKDLIHFLTTLPQKIPKPKAIVMISAHWESSRVKVSSTRNPSMIYDYGGFPAPAYSFQYPAAGDPELAKKITHLLTKNSIDCSLDAQRGFDHGSFVPLMLMYPAADIAIVQISLHDSLDPKQHIAIGKALAPLREQGVLIIGSGLSCHNMRPIAAESKAFDEWLTKSLENTSRTKTEESLKQWQLAPFARRCHSREEHLIPLHVCFGAAFNRYTPAQKIFSSIFYQNQISAFLWR